MVKMIEPQTKPKISQQTRRNWGFSQLLLRKLNFTSFMSTEGAETRFFQCSSSSRIWRMGVSFFSSFFSPEKSWRSILKISFWFFGDHGLFFGPDPRIPAVGNLPVIHSYVSGAEVSLSFAGVFQPAQGVGCFASEFEQNLTDLDRYSSIGTIDTQTVEFFKPLGPWHLLKVPFHPRKNHAAFTTTSGEESLFSTLRGLRWFVSAWRRSILPSPLRLPRGGSLWPKKPRLKKLHRLNGFWKFNIKTWKAIKWMGLYTSSTAQGGGGSFKIGNL